MAVCAMFCVCIGFQSYKYCFFNQYDLQNLILIFLTEYLRHGCVGFLYRVLYRVIVFEIFTY